MGSPDIYNFLGSGITPSSSDTNGLENLAKSIKSNDTLGNSLYKPFSDSMNSLKDVEATNREIDNNIYKAISGAYSNEAKVTNANYINLINQNNKTSELLDKININAKNRADKYKQTLANKLYADINFRIAKGDINNDDILEKIRKLGGLSPELSVLANASLDKKQKELYENSNISATPYTNARTLQSNESYANLNEYSKLGTIQHTSTISAISYKDISNKNISDSLYTPTMYLDKNLTTDATKTATNKVLAGAGIDTTNLNDQTRGQYNGIIKLAVNNVSNMTSLNPDDIKQNNRILDDAFQSRGVPLNVAHAIQLSIRLNDYKSIKEKLKDPNLNPKEREALISRLMLDRAIFMNSFNDIDYVLDGNTKADLKVQALDTFEMSKVKSDSNGEEIFDLSATPRNLRSFSSDVVAIGSLNGRDSKLILQTAQNNPNSDEYIYKNIISSSMTPNGNIDYDLVAEKLRDPRKRRAFENLSKKYPDTDVFTEILNHYKEATDIRSRRLQDNEASIKDYEEKNKNEIESVTKALAKNGKIGDHVIASKSESKVEAMTFYGLNNYIQPLADSLNIPIDTRYKVETAIVDGIIKGTYNPTQRKAISEFFTNASINGQVTQSQAVKLFSELGIDPSLYESFKQAPIQQTPIQQSPIQSTPNSVNFNNTLVSSSTVGEKELTPENTVNPIPNYDISGEKPYSSSNSIQVDDLISTANNTNISNSNSITIPEKPKTPQPSSSISDVNSSDPENVPISKENLNNFFHSPEIIADTLDNPSKALNSLTPEQNKIYFNKTFSKDNLSPAQEYEKVKALKLIAEATRVFGEDWNANDPNDVRKITTTRKLMLKKLNRSDIKEILNPNFISTLEDLYKNGGKFNNSSKEINKITPEDLKINGDSLAYNSDTVNFKNLGYDTNIDSISNPFVKEAVLKGEKNDENFYIKYGREYSKLHPYQISFKNYPRYFQTKSNEEKFANLMRNYIQYDPDTYDRLFIKIGYPKGSPIYEEIKNDLLSADYEKFQKAVAFFKDKAEIDQIVKMQENPNKKENAFTENTVKNSYAYKNKKVETELGYSPVPNKSYLEYLGENAVNNYSNYKLEANKLGDAVINRELLNSGVDVNKIPKDTIAVYTDNQVKFYTKAELYERYNEKNQSNNALRQIKSGNPEALGELNLSNFDNLSSNAVYLNSNGIPRNVSTEVGGAIIDTYGATPEIRAVGNFIKTSKNGLNDILNTNNIPRIIPGDKNGFATQIAAYSVVASTSNANSKDIFNSTKNKVIKSRVSKSDYLTEIGKFSDIGFTSLSTSKNYADQFAKINLMQGVLITQIKRDVGTGIPEYNKNLVDSYGIKDKPLAMKFLNGGKLDPAELITLVGNGDLRKLFKGFMESNGNKKDDIVQKIKNIDHRFDNPQNTGDSPNNLAKTLEFKNSLDNYTASQNTSYRKRVTRDQVKFNVGKNYSQIQAGKKDPDSVSKTTTPIYSDDSRKDIAIESLISTK